MDNLPAVRETEQLAGHFVKSGFFADARQESQAVVKIIAGRELGIGPVQAMMGIYIVKGRITLSANLLASLIKRSGRYDYRVRELTHERCRLEFFERGESVGESSFSIDDARRANLLGGDNWKHYPRNMLFARALANGQKLYAPDVTDSPVYTPDEMGLKVDGETGEVIDAPAQPSGNGHAAIEPARDERRERLRALWEKMKRGADEVQLPVSPFPDEMTTEEAAQVYESIVHDVARQVKERKAAPQPAPVSVAAEPEALDEPDPFVEEA